MRWPLACDLSDPTGRDDLGLLREMMLTRDIHECDTGRLAANA